MSSSALPGSRRNPTWADVLSAVIVIDVLMVLLAVGIAGYAIYARLEQAAYQAAPICHAGVHASDCRDQRTATIVDGGVSGGKGGGYHWVTTNLPGFAGRRTKVWPELWEQLSAGESVQVETWHGRITMISGVQTRDNPNDEASGAIWLELGPAGLIATSFIPAIPAWIITRRRRRQSSAASGAA